MYEIEIVVNQGAEYTKLIREHATALKGVMRMISNNKYKLCEVTTAENITQMQHVAKSTIVIYHTNPAMLESYEEGKTE